MVCALPHVLTGFRERRALVVDRQPGLEVIPRSGVAVVDDFTWCDDVRIIERAGLDHHDLPGKITGGIQPSAACPAEMPSDAATAFAAVREGRGIPLDPKLAAMNANDGRVPGAGGLLAIFAATLCFEKAGADYGVAELSAEAATHVCFVVLEHINE